MCIRDSSSVISGTILSAVSSVILGAVFSAVLAIILCTAFKFKVIIILKYIVLISYASVSYTHLDVYKRQLHTFRQRGDSA